MSETASNVVTYTRRDADAGRSPALRLTLEPERVEGANRATLSDIDAMIAMARSGASARNRQIARCRWARWDNGDLICTLALWVWPSDIDLEYSLSLPPGVTSAERVLTREPRDVKVWVAGSGGDIELPWLLESASFVWHPRIGVWDAWSRPETPPGITQERARLILSGEGDRYGVLWARGTAVGWRHDISIRYPTGGGNERPDTDKTDPRAPVYLAYIPGGGSDPAAPGISIKNADDIKVTATWTDETGEQREESATLTIPECVKRLLEKCPQGTKRTGNIRVKPADDDQGPVQVYYNSCTGAILDVRRGKK